MKLELGSWRVWELWEEEWPRFKVFLFTYRDQLYRLGLALRARLREKDRTYIGQVLHELMDCVTEGIRLIGFALVTFGYSLAHGLVVVLLIWMLIAGWQAGYIAGMG